MCNSHDILHQSIAVDQAWASNPFVAWHHGQPGQHRDAVSYAGGCRCTHARGVCTSNLAQLKTASLPALGIQSRLHPFDVVAGHLVVHTVAA